MAFSIDELASDVVDTTRILFEKAMKMDKPFVNNWEAFWFHLLLIYESGEHVLSNGRVINSKRKVAEDIAKRIIEGNNYLLMDVLGRNLGKPSSQVSEEDKRFLSYLGPRSVIPLGTYVDAVEKARPEIVRMMADVKQKAYRGELIAK